MPSFSFVIRSRILDIAAPVAAGLAAVAAVGNGRESPPALVADLASSVRQSATASILNLGTAFDGMLFGRGDPKTRKGKIKRKSYGKCRPKQKMDWRQWSESQLLLPERDIPIPWPPAAKRSEVVPFPKLVLGEGDLELVKDWAAGMSQSESDPAEDDNVTQQQQQQPQ